MIYLDSAATTKIAPSVLEAMLPYLKEEFGNAGTVHGLGRKARAAIDNARRQVAEFINCEPDQIIFTSGGTESNNMVLLGLSEHLRSLGKNHIIVSATEHNSVLKAAERLMKQGFYVTKVPVLADGSVDPEDVVELIGPDTGLVSVMMVNNELGVANQVERIGQICADSGVLFHTDCVQAASQYELDVQEIQCDFLTLSAHKIHGPKGVGAVYARNKDILSPIIWGGSGQEFGVRGGTENVPAIVGFGAACRYIKELSFENTVWYTFLKQRFYNELQKACKEYGYSSGMTANGNSLKGFGKILSVCFEDVDAETLLLALSANEVYVSAGSACDSKNTNPSHVLKAIGLSDEEARRTIRISFDDSNSLKDVEHAAKIFARCLTALSGVVENG